MTAVFTNKMRSNGRKRYFYYRCTCTNKKDWASCSIKQTSAARLDRYIIDNLKKISQNGQYLDSLSFTLNHKPSGYDAGIELNDSGTELSAEVIKETLHKIIEAASIKGDAHKGLIMKRHIKNIIYSKEEIEIKLYKSSDFGRFSDDNSINKIKSEALLPQPKMPPSIFGCGNPTNHKNSRAAGGVGEKEIVCGNKNGGSPRFLPNHPSDYTQHYSWVQEEGFTQIIVIEEAVFSPPHPRKNRFLICPRRRVLKLNIWGVPV
jgi:hypothetical protein